MLGVGIAGMLWAPGLVPSTMRTAAIERIWTVFPWLFVPLMCVYQIARLYSGDHGIDFAIFTQAIRSVRDVGAPMTSLVAPEPVSFLSHHFAPFLYGLGWLSRFTLPPYLIGILSQSLSIGVALYFFYQFCRVLGFSTMTSAVATTLLCVNPTFRSGVSWGIHDEVFALGFIGGAFYAWARGNYRAVIACLLLTTLFKETFFVAVAIAAAVLSVQSYRRSEETRKVALAYGALSVVAVAASIFYFMIIPRYPEIFQMSFRAGSRIPSIDTLLSGSFISAKISFLLAVLVPVLALPLLSRQGILVWLCALPFWGACLISTFEEMHKAYNYYGVVPTYVAFFASALVARERWGTEMRFTPKALLILTCLAFSAGYRASPFNPLLQLSRTGAIIPDSLTMIPSNLTIAVSEFDAVFVQDKGKIVRLWSAERIPMRWDIVLVRAGTREPPSARILKGTSKCYEDPRWTIFCRKGVSLPTSAPPAGVVRASGDPST